MTARTETLNRLWMLIKDIRVAMLTTVSADGRLVSRPMGTQEATFDGDLWFATECDSAKAADIAANPLVNVAYASPEKNIYVSVAGRAKLVRDRNRIEQFWSPAMQAFFPGGKDDPNLCLIRVVADSAEYWDGPSTLLGKALLFALASVTDEPLSTIDNARVELNRR